jgi:hypothetical protein
VALKLPGAALLAGWPTPDAGAMNDGQPWEANQARRDRMRERHHNGNGAGLTLAAAAQAAGWPTPTTRDWKDGAADGTAPANGLLGRVAWEAKGPARLTADGRILIGSDAGMGNGGRLNPEHSRWLMGYPGAWDDCGATVMPSSRKSRRSS